MRVDPGQLGAEVVEVFRGAGFAAVGVTEATPTIWARELAEWIAMGKHGSMAYLEEHLEMRLDPRRVLEKARSIVVAADQYATRADADDLPVLPGHGRIARYARGRDYHVVVRKRLHDVCDTLRRRHPGAAFRAFVDTAPVLEREYAARAGIGWTGKHTLTINPRLGSYLLLGGVLTTLELRPPPEQRAVPDRCGTCTRCIDACPTRAITPYSVDATRCVSYLTIERREAIEPEFFPALGEWLFGCDICQEVCPHNSAREDGVDVGRANPAYRGHRDSFRLLDVLGWTEDDRRSEFAGTALKRATLDMMKRNAIIVSGNWLRRKRDERIVGALRRIAESEFESEMVREAARHVLEGLAG